MIREGIRESGYALLREAPPFAHPWWECGDPNNQASPEPLTGVETRLSVVEDGGRDQTPIAPE